MWWVKFSYSKSMGIVYSFEILFLRPFFLLCGQKINKELSNIKWSSHLSFSVKLL